MAPENQPRKRSSPTVPESAWAIVMAQIRDHKFAKIFANWSLFFWDRRAYIARLDTLDEGKRIKPLGAFLSSVALYAIVAAFIYGAPTTWAQIAPILNKNEASAERFYAFSRNLIAKHYPLEYSRYLVDRQISLINVRDAFIDSQLLRERLVPGSSYTSVAIFSEFKNADMGAVSLELKKKNEDLAHDIAIAVAEARSSPIVKYMKLADSLFRDFIAVLFTFISILPLHFFLKAGHHSIRYTFDVYIAYVSWWTVISAIYLIADASIAKYEEVSTAIFIIVASYALYDLVKTFYMSHNRGVFRTVLAIVGYAFVVATFKIGFRQVVNLLL